jgi:hypothetical protein
MKYEGISPVPILLLLVGAVIVGIVLKARSRQTRVERARETAEHTAAEALDQARYLYDHRDELSAEALRMAQEASRVAQRALDFVRESEPYQRRDDLVDDLTEAKEELQSAYRRIAARLGI